VKRSCCAYCAKSAKRRTIQPSKKVFSVDWVGKQIRIRYDDLTTNGGVKDGVLQSADDNELILQTPTGTVAIPRARVVRIEVIR